MNSLLGLAGPVVPTSTPRGTTLVAVAGPLLLPQIARLGAIYAGAFFLVAFIQGNERKLADLRRMVRPYWLYAGVPALAAVGVCAAALPKLGI